MLNVLMGLLTGAAFGVVLYKVGATRYSRIMGMLTLRDTKVMKFVFTAIAVASILYGLAAALGIAEAARLVPRTLPFIGLAHLAGGALFGIGLGISGLCPGTCVAKAGGGGGDKRFAAHAAIAGLFAGVLAYAALKPVLIDQRIIAEVQQPLTLHGVLGLSYAAVALAFGAIVLVVVLAIDRLTTERSYAPARERTSVLDHLRGEWSWLAAGTAGGVLVVLATAQGGYLGFSGGVLALTGWLAHLAGAPMELVPRIDADIMWRAALIIGVLPGAIFAKAFSTPSKAFIEAPLAKTFDARALAKSFGATTVMTLGALIGGGCTTGAFIAAWPTLSLGSFAMAGTFFAVSMSVGTTRLLISRTLDMTSAQAIGDRVYD